MAEEVIFNGKSMKVLTVDGGDDVICDWCNKDWSLSDVSGGFLFGSYATCPDCAPDAQKSITKYKEEWNIKGSCPKDMSFADWIRSIR